MNNADAQVAISNRRIAAAVKAIERERDTLPLFAKDNPAANETPLERIQRFDNAIAQMWAMKRVASWKKWWECVEHLRFIESVGGDPHRIIRTWKAGMVPKDAGFFGNHLWTLLLAMSQLQRVGLWDGPAFDVVYMTDYFKIEVHPCADGD